MGNIDDDLKKYKKMCQVADRLAEVSMCNDTVKSDDDELIAFLSDEKKKEALMSRLRNSSRANKYLSHLASSDKERDTKLLEAKIRELHKSHRFSIYHRISTAAAVLIAFCALLYYTIDNRKKEILAYTPQTESAMPVILFDNGEHIDLNDAENTKLMSSENISVIEKGKVKYDKAEVVGDVAIKYNTAIIPAKHTLDIELSDGTKIKLNANSTLRFPVKFKGDDRTVELTGEGYFVVAKSNKPFVVKIGNCSVKVYGTEFNVNMNKKDVIETTLIEGSVGFKSENNKEVMLRPNQCVRLHKETNAINVYNVDVWKNIGWKNGYFLCEQEKLTVLLDEISNWYGINIIMENKSVQDIEISLNVDRSILLPDLLRLLEDMLKIKFLNEGNGKYILM